ncbi:hypothetical protein BT96DRAFT_668533 [Gymnopus androsaceus JB14]|uniref:LysM domain-containing protein n=1 Tax=Gymnopus androsaceus JB14 TaxID=1447944 RepID=A0A6A4IG41_9AGAR|nr:hypothetical protein BT96DRAFT_668533 [Gymnopus androsaceus JB14]
MANSGCEVSTRGVPIFLSGMSFPSPRPSYPSGSTTSYCTTNYTVALGDVCISIANQLEANTEINANQCVNLMPDEVLCIP